MKLWLYACFIAIFTVVFSQIAFPLAVRIDRVTVIPSAGGAYRAVFGNLEDETLKDMEAATKVPSGEEDIGNQLESRHVVEFELGIESTRLMSIGILESRIEVGEGYKKRVLAATINTPDKVNMLEPAYSKATVIYDTCNMTEGEIKEMVKSTKVYVGWDSLFGSRRENKAYMVESMIK